MIYRPNLISAEESAVLIDCLEQAGGKLFVEEPTMQLSLEGKNRVKLTLTPYWWPDLKGIALVEIGQILAEPDPTHARPFGHAWEKQMTPTFRPNDKMLEKELSQLSLLESNWTTKPFYTDGTSTWRQFVERPEFIGQFITSEGRILVGHDLGMPAIGLPNGLKLHLQIFLMQVAKAGSGSPAGTTHLRFMGFDLI